MKLSGLRVELPREEYDALCYLRDVAYQEARTKIAALERIVQQFEMIEAQSKKVIDEQSLLLDHTRKESLERHALILKMQARLQELEPARFETQQPGRGR